MSHPILKVWYSDNGANGILFSVEKFDEELECETCGKVGSYWMINEKYKIGSCRSHIEEGVGEGKLFKKLEETNSDSLEGINPVEDAE